MKSAAYVRAVVAAGLVGLVAGCGGDDAVNMTGVWDVTDVTGRSIESWSLTQAGNDLSGTALLTCPISGTVNGSDVVFTITLPPPSTTVINFNCTLSADGNSMAGTWSSGADSGQITALRRGTGEGVDMTGNWVSTDLETGVSVNVQIVQNINTLELTVSSNPGTKVAGTVNGSEVDFTTQVGGNFITWTGYLSWDGNTVSGHWENSGVINGGYWVMVRQ